MGAEAPVAMLARDNSFLRHFRDCTTHTEWSEGVPGRRSISNLGPKPG